MISQKEIVLIFFRSHFKKSMTARMVHYIMNKTNYFGYQISLQNIRRRISELTADGYLIKTKERVVEKGEMTAKWKLSEHIIYSIILRFNGKNINNICKKRNI